ncbi:helix-turn-helix transcriptional regulator [Nonomuraea sp. NPDC048881]|uniref:PadR family transcriptional regulator n=1 Tax=Nonomuraea sp. NPDC048881 TaxID=3155030 RepID=UPI0033CE72EF
MGSLPRMTMPTMLVLRALLEEPTRAMYGLEICAAAGLPSGTIHPILARLEGFGWLESSWEELDPREEGRPRRRYYRFTPDGAQLARQALDRSAAKRAALRLRPSGGVA